MGSSNNVLKKNDALAWRIIDGEAFIVHPGDGLIYPLNAVATRIWELVNGRRPIAEIVNVIQEEFDADEPTIEKDVSSFLADSMKRNLVVVAEER